MNHSLTTRWVCGLMLLTACNKNDQAAAEQAQTDAEAKARDAQQEANAKIGLFRESGRPRRGL